MANRIPITSGSWPRVEELLDAGDPEFVDELRRIQDADRLGSFANILYQDKRPSSRKLLMEYLRRPFNAFRHEAFVKRLFKIAEGAQDDEVMGHFMVGLDRSIRRERVSRDRYDWSTRESWTEEFIRTPRPNALPRSTKLFFFRDRETGTPIAARTMEKHLRLVLFSDATRKYLRRRVWRYFRQLGKLDPNRYVTSIASALALYTDEDCADGLALLDNWSLVHTLFHECDAIDSKSQAWRLAPGRSLSELRPAPALLAAWQSNSEQLLLLLDQANCRPVRQWAIRMLREQTPDVVARVSIDRLLLWITSQDEELARFASELLIRSPAIADLRASTWLHVLAHANTDVLEVVCLLIRRMVSPETVSLRQAVDVACSRAIPAAELGMSWLEFKTPVTDDEYRDLLLGLDAPSEVVRPKLVAMIRRKLDGVETKRVDWILEYLDSRHADVREQGWSWLSERSEIARDHQLWQRLTETPYDDVRQRLLELLRWETDHRMPNLNATAIVDAKQLDPERLRFLWAAALLNIHRFGKRKPGIVKAIVDRLQAHVDETEQLLPILSIALRSVRSLEWRAGLAGIVSLIEKNPELSSLVGTHFPELDLI